MFSRLLGHYVLGDVWAWLFSRGSALQGIAEYLPAGHQYFFSCGREALLSALMARRTESDNPKCVAVPAWGCPVVLECVKRAGFVPLLFDVSPHAIHMDIGDIVNARDKYDIDSVILVAENGIPYTNEEVDTLRDAGFFVVADYALAWQNAMSEGSLVADCRIYSGGLGKPVSGAGLGVLVAEHALPIPQLKQARSGFGTPAKLMAHVVLQNPSTNGLLGQFVPKIVESEVSSKVYTPCGRSATLVKRSLDRLAGCLDEWREVQGLVREELLRRESKSPLVYRDDALQTKIVFEKSLLANAQLRGEIDFHSQYSCDLISLNGVALLNKRYEGVESLREEYLSFCINWYVIHRPEEFIGSFRTALHG